MAFLDENGLKLLINRIQTQTIQTQEYENVVAAAADEGVSGSVFFLKIRKNSNSPWIVKYKVTSEIPTINNSTQMAEVIFAGIDAKLSYFNINNIIYDEARQSAKNHIIVLKNNDESNYIGINIANHYSDKHNLKIEIEYLYGCSVAFLEEAKGLSNLDYVQEIKTFDFLHSGTFLDSEQNFVKTDDLANVAFSGDYNDLINKPALLETGIDEEELYFFKI